MLRNSLHKRLDAIECRRELFQNILEPISMHRASFRTPLSIDFRFSKRLREISELWETSKVLRVGRVSVATRRLSAGIDRLR
jgi:hypothetical protein